MKPIALFKMRDDDAIDDKVVCVPLSDPNWNHMETLDDVPLALRDEISHFFSIYKTPQGKVVKVDGWHTREAAWEEIHEARERRAREEPRRRRRRTAEASRGRGPRHPGGAGPRAAEGAPLMRARWRGPPRGPRCPVAHPGGRGAVLCGSAADACVDRVEDAAVVRARELVLELRARVVARRPAERQVECDEPCRLVLLAAAGGRRRLGLGRGLGLGGRRVLLGRPGGLCLVGLGSGLRLLGRSGIGVSTVSRSPGGISSSAGGVSATGDRFGVAAGVSPAGVSASVSSRRRPT